MPQFPCQVCLQYLIQNKYASMHGCIHTYIHASLILHQVYMTKKPQTIIKYSKLAFILPSVILKTCKYALKRAPQQWPVCCHTSVMAQLMEVQEPWTIAVLEMGADSSPRPGAVAVVAVLTLIRKHTHLRRQTLLYSTLRIIFGSYIYGAFSSKTPKWVWDFLRCLGF